MPYWHIATTPQPNRCTMWLTTTIDQTGHIDHAVPHAELATRSGSYTAVCGITVSPASLLTPPGPRCIRCVTHLDTTAARHQRSQHRHPTRRHKPGRLLRILGSRLNRNTNSPTER